MFVTYMVITVLRMKKTNEETSKNDTEEELERKVGEDFTVESENTGSKDSLLKDIILLVVGAVLIAVGADLLVDNAIIIAEKFNVSQKVIGLTIVALGTSLPELVTAITSLAKGHGSLSLGNIIGANLFNLVLVSGVAVTLNPFDVPVAGLIGGINASLVLDIPIMLIVMLILTVPTLIKEKLSRWQGILLLAIYLGFIAFQFII